MTEKNREAFEAWFESTQRKNIEQFPAMERRRLMQMASYAWMASREEITIHFPDLSADKFCWSDGTFNLRDDLIQKLTSLGIRVKGNE